MFVQNQSDNSLLTVKKKSKGWNFGVEGGVELAAVGVSEGVSLGHQKSQSVSTDRVKKYLAENFQHNEWNGEKFVTKPMKLSRLNLSKLKAEQTITSSDVQVEEFTDTYQVKIMIDDSRNKVRPNEASVINALQAELDYLKTTTVPQLQAKMDAKIDSLINDTIPELKTDIENLIASKGKARDLCYLNNDENHECPEGFGESAMSFYGSMKDEIIFETPTNISNNLYSIYHEYIEFFYCCKEN